MIAIEILVTLEMKVWQCGLGAAIQNMHRSMECAEEKQAGQAGQAGQWRAKPHIGTAPAAPRSPLIKSPMVGVSVNDDLRTLYVRGTLMPPPASPGGARLWRRELIVHQNFTGWYQSPTPSRHFIAPRSPATPRQGARPRGGSVSRAFW